MDIYGRSSGTRRRRAEARAVNRLIPEADDVREIRPREVRSDKDQTQEEEPSAKRHGQDATNPPVSLSFLRPSDPAADAKADKAKEETAKQR
jgi:hypothetical protein